jgi:2-desacetyl-2-hydroxyethyl bacteriochlorophyllide A dehydrogenase
MLQVTLETPGRFVAGDVAPPTAMAGEAIVRVRRIGVCGTDLHAFAGRQPFFSYPRILGHELGVEVVSVPSHVRGLRPGDHCAVEPYLSCGTCSACLLGRTNCCESLRVLGVHIDGGMREQIAVPVERLFRSDKLSLDQLALVETLGIGYHAVERSQLKPDETVLVVGAGPIGLAVTQFAKVAGGRVRVLETSANRRRFAEERFGVTTLERPDEHLANVVFDATGNPAAMAASLERVAFGGRLVFVGLVLAKVAIDDPLFHRREITLFASRNSRNAFPTIIGQIEAGRIDTSPWITHRLSLAEVPDRFAGLPAQPGVVKAMIEVG